MLIEFLEKYNPDAQVMGRAALPLLKLAHPAGLSFEGNDVDPEKCTMLIVGANLGPKPE
jgi:hypothetical protein